ncbi:MAG: hypothetical protein LBU09_04455, partial [Endomicrobium sp.]|nr:hypothetical protein [Endomicrobium sp.]
MLKKFFRVYFIKTTALIAANFFFFSCVYAQAAFAFIESARQNGQISQSQFDFTIPYPHGKITSSNFFASSDVIINIQDLHSHPHVQKNIAKIIEAFDRQYGVAEIYLEGAYGCIDTSWLYEIDAGDKVKDELFDRLINTGRLTGAEYYCAKKRRADLIKGLENREEYAKNLNRFSDIIDAQKEIRPLLDDIAKDTALLKKIYYGKNLKKLDKIKYGKTNRDYLKKLFKYADRLNIDAYKYENILLYKSTFELEKNAVFKKASRELGFFVNALKNILPYSAYIEISQNTGGFSDSAKVCAYVLKAAADYGINLNKSYPNLAKLSLYYETGRKINPIELVNEEERLFEEINESFFSNESEKEAAFIVNFSRRLKDLLSGQISADDWAYYEENKNRFRILWAKYIGSDRLSKIEKYENLAGDFYKANEKRNEYFLSNIAVKNGALNDAADNYDDGYDAFAPLKYADRLNIDAYKY